MRPFFEIRRLASAGLIAVVLLGVFTFLQEKQPSALSADTAPPEVILATPYGSDMVAADSLVQRGRVFEALSRFERAERALRETPGLSKNDLSWVWLNMARTLIRADQSQTAQTWLDSVTAQSGGPWSGAAWIVKGSLKQAAGRFGDALTLYLKGVEIDGGDTEGVTALRIGYCYHKTKQYAQAVSWYDRAAKTLPEIEDYALYLSAQCLMETAQTAEATRRLNDLYRRFPHSLRYDAARDRHFEDMLEKGEWDAVVEETRRRLETDHDLDGENRASLLARAAEAHDRAARPDSARAIHRTLLTVYRSASAARAAVPALTALAERNGPPLSAEEKLWIGQAHLEQGDYTSATRYLLALASATADSAVTPYAAYHLNRARFLQKLYVTAETGFRQILSRHPRHPVAGLASFHVARCIRARKGTTASVAAYVAFAETYPANETAPDALFFAGEQLEDAGRFTEAARHFHRIASQYPKYQKRDDARWLEGYCLYRAGRLEAAAAAFDQQAREDSLSVYAPKSLYWQGKAFQKLGRRAAATLAYDRVMSGYPGSYYTYQAMLRLNELDGRPVTRRLTGWAPTDRMALQPPTVDFVEFVKQFEEKGFPSERELPHIRRAELLFAAGLTAEAEEETEHFTKGNPGNPVALARATAVYFQYRQYRQGIRMAGRLQSLMTRIAPDNDAASSFLYPYAFWEVVRKQADTLNLDPLFVLSVMRQESRFEYTIKSWAGAHGLMQLMPKTAKELARQRNFANHSNERLYEPEYNVALGTQYLVDMIRTYKGRLELAVAAYNGGPGRVSRWVREQGLADMDEFVERIGITETRQYVKAVMNNYARYTTDAAMTNEARQ
ncbi:MAG: transglycosylase SLT domain-containing protein [candidate division Zixibacteria bacterium]|nr:transglycosylase SLT domain-containing protein [candidate division Zixibacteria bacterium]